MNGAARIIRQEDIHRFELALPERDVEPVLRAFAVVAAALVPVDEHGLAVGYMSAVVVGRRKGCSVEVLVDNIVHD